MPEPKNARQIQSPRGTRDLYPAEAARRRWLLDRWREVSVRHGFEEVDGPTFEESELYAVKSGEGILGELFQAFSGKSPDEVEQVKQTGRAPFALRPEFTPTLARMYAAKAAGLPKPCKWFMAGPFFRAERPQRGRLREFLQWNADVIGLDVPQEKWNAEDAESRAEVAEAKARMDAEVIACCVESLRVMGLDPQAVQIRINSRESMRSILDRLFVSGPAQERAFSVIDRYRKIDEREFEREMIELGADPNAIDALRSLLDSPTQIEGELDAFLVPARYGELGNALIGMKFEPSETALFRTLGEYGITDWCHWDCSIVRGLAYYTGTVFEVIAEGERAVAGGGRYDNLIELFGGPPTPAVGFAMGDVVLSLLLQDKGLMPSDDELMGLVGQHPEVFVLSNGTPEADAALRPLVARLRRGAEPSELKTQDSRLKTPLHVRHSYKATKNVGKLLKEAAQSHARFAVIIEDGSSCSVKDLRENQQWEGRVELADIHTRLCEALRA
jgi:histidyl-tRNA synthetase